MDNIQIELRNKLLDLRGSLCEYCQERPWSQLHHGIISRDKNYKKYLDVELNYMCSCPVCNVSRVVDPYHVRQLFYCIQEVRGYPVKRWLQTLPFKVKPKFDEVSYNAQFLANILHLPIRQILTLDQEIYP